jgi:hypothetical protein
MESPVKEDEARIISKFLSANSGKIGSLKIKIDSSRHAPANPLFIKLIEAIGKSEITELNVQCRDEELYYHILTNATKMLHLKQLTFRGARDLWFSNQAQPGHTNYQFETD